MLELSGRYWAATTDSQRSELVAAAQAMLSVGQSHTPGTFMAFLLSEIAGIIICAVMLRSEIFSKAAAVAGIFGFTLLLIFEVISSFFASPTGVAMFIAIAGGLLSMVWYVLIAVRLFQLGSRVSIPGA